MGILEIQMERLERIAKVWFWLRYVKVSCSYGHIVIIIRLR